MLLEGIPVARSTSSRMLESSKGSAARVVVEIPKRKWSVRVSDLRCIFTMGVFRIGEEDSGKRKMFWRSRKDEYLMKHHNLYIFQVSP